MARGHARLATRTTVEIDVEGILLSRPGRSGRQQFRVIPGLRRNIAVFMLTGELLDGGQLLLFDQ
jgi:hypothetical protein